MIAIRRAEERGHFEQALVAAYHTFSFDRYRDPEHTGFRTLRALNEERVQPGAALPRRVDREAEVLSYVIEGALEERDPTGSTALVRSGELRLTHARRGEDRGELNPSEDVPVRYLQFWLEPGAQNGHNSAEQRRFSIEDKRGKLLLVASKDGREDSLPLALDTEVYASVLASGDEVRHALAAERHAWVQVARGAIEVNGRLMTEGDGAAVSGEREVVIHALREAEVLVFDLA